MENRDAMDKQSESLKESSGSAGEFSNWAKRFMDHMGRVHADWKNAVKFMAATKEDISYRRLAGEVMGPWGEHAADLARKLEQTIVDYMPEKIYNRRQQLCGGYLQEGHGFMRWRALHREFIGEDEVIEYAGT